MAALVINGDVSGSVTLQAPSVAGTTTLTLPTVSGTIAVSGAAPTFSGITDSGNLTFTGTGNRITGDFSNAAVANRVVFQSSTTNGNTNLNAIPNGTSQQAVVGVFNNSDPTNASATSVLVNASESSVRAGIVGTGTYLPMTFYTGGSERMRIDSSGNVGIGTSSPGTKLDVVGANVVVKSNASSGYGSFYANGATGNAAYYFFAINGTETGRIYSDASNYIAFATGSSATERMRIDSSGNVGIGTGSPGAKLDVVGTSTTDIFHVSNSTSYFTVGVTAGTGAAVNAYQSGVGPLTLQLQTAGGAATFGGNVGIGTTSPGYRLDVIGSTNGNVVSRVGNLNTGASTQSILQIATGASSERYINLNVNYTSQYFQNAGAGITTLYQDYDTQFFRNNVGTVRASIDSVGNFSFNSGYGSAATAYGCRAWVNFNGTGTVAIRASGNVSSITDNGTCDYTVNFTTAMPDANYGTNVTAPHTTTAGSGIGNYFSSGPTPSINQTASAVRVTAFNGSNTGTYFDSPNVTVSIFR